MYGLFAWAEAVLFQAYCGKNHPWKTSLGKPRQQFLLPLGPMGLIAEHFTMTILFTGCLPKERTWLVACWFVSQANNFKIFNFSAHRKLLRQILYTCLNILMENQARKTQLWSILGIRKEKATRRHILSFIESCAHLDASPGQTRCYKSPLLLPSTSLCQPRNFSCNTGPVVFVSYSRSCHISCCLNTLFFVASASPCTKH